MSIDTLRASLVDRYTISRELGRGGMATVYLAHDLKHDRDVAIKVLRRELGVALGAERFLAEIRTTAQLRHPNILPLFDSGEADGLVFYVMPYVEGESLRARIDREGQLGVTESVRITGAVVAALEHAHMHGVIHRDIKPENILLQDGHAVVSDFGIAIAVRHAADDRITQTGFSVGTPQYMSPEQAAAEREIDGRSDQYSLASVLYEMLTGEPPFTGPNAGAVMARLMSEPAADITRRRPSVPAFIATAVHQALEKVPGDRFASVAAFGDALTPQTRLTGSHRTASATPHRNRAVPIALAAGAALGIGVAAFLLGGRVLGRQAPPLEFGQTLQVTSDPGLAVQPAISPNGQAVAYAAGTSGGTRIYVRQVSGGRANPLTDDSTASQTNPRWSPDGSRILFLQSGAAFSAPAAGGRAHQEIPAGHGNPVESVAWGPDGQTIAYVVADSLFIRNPAGDVRRLADFSEPSMCTWSPNGALIACASGNARYLTIGADFGNLSPNRIVVCRVSDASQTVVTDSLSINQSPVWSPQGHWLYYVSNRRGRGDIYAQRVSRSGRISGGPVRLTTGLGAQSISLSSDGSRFAYGLYTASANIWAMPAPSSGPVSPVTATQVTTGTQVIENVSVSSDGKWLLYDSNRSGKADLYRMPIAGGEAERLTSDAADDFAPALSPDGKEVAFHSWRAGSRDIYVQPLDGRPLQRVTSTPTQELIPVWSPDGSTIAYMVGNTERSIWLVQRDANGRWGPPVEREPRGGWAAWSPDGKSIAYVTGLQGGSLMVAPADSGAARRVLDDHVATNPRAEQPFWSRDGRLLYFKSHDANGNASIWSMPSTGGKPTLLVRFTDPAHPSYRSQWAYGANRFFFPIQERQSDVWVINVKTP